MPVIGEAKGVRRDCLDDDAVEGPVEFVTWNNGGDRFAAIGRNVYRFNGGRLTGATRMKYPGCLPVHALRRQDEAAEHDAGTDRETVRSDPRIATGRP